MEDYIVGFGDNKVDYYSNFNTKYPGGNAVNFSVAGKKYGLPSYYVGSISCDDDGELIYSSLEALGVNLSYCERTKDSSEKVFVEIKDGERYFLSSERSIRRTPDITNELLHLFKKSLLVHTGCHANTEIKLEDISKNNVKISFDFSDLDKYRTDDYLELVCPNIYIAQFSVAGNTDSAIERLVSKCAEFGVKFILLTRGNMSPIFVDVENKKEYQGFIRKAQHPKDTMGAGDTYFATFAISLMKFLKYEKMSEELVIKCFEEAADNAYDTLYIEGSFGFGKKIVDKVD